jgi:hypothetical protein
MGKAKTYRQYDSRWANDPFPKHPDNMGNSGCGPTAIADIVATIKPKVTPKQTGAYMRKHGYAIFGAGSAHAGIMACMKAYGLIPTKHDTMPQFFKAMQKKGAVGIVVFRAGSRGGVTWTSVGHFVACSKVKVKNGLHYMYMHDPGARKHDGWYCYEKHMTGLIPSIWSGVPKAKPKPKPKPKPKKPEKPKEKEKKVEVKKLDCKSKTIKIPYEIEAGSLKKIKIEAVEGYSQIGIMAADTDDNFVVVKGFDVDFDGGYISLLNLLNTRRTGILKYQCFALPTKSVK